MCACAREDVGIYMQRPEVSLRRHSSRAVYLVLILRQGLSLIILELTRYVGLVNQRDPRTCVSQPPQCWGYKRVPQTLLLYVVLREANAGPHVLVIGTSLAEPSLRPTL